MKEQQAENRDTVTVIIVSYNSLDYLQPCLKSIGNSSIPARVIVVDNASSDNSASWLMEQEIIATDCIFNNENVGFARAVNQGLNRVETEYSLLLNPDCLLGRDTLKIMLQEMQSHPDAGMAGCLILNEDGSEQSGCRRQIPTAHSAFNRLSGLSRLFKKTRDFTGFELHKTPLPEQSTSIEAISGSFMFLRSAAVEQVGLLDEDYFMHCEDLDYCQQFHDAGLDVLFVPYTCILHFKGKSSNTRAVFVSWHMHRGMSRFYRKFQASGFLRGLVVELGIWLRFLSRVLSTGVDRIRSAFSRRTDDIDSMLAPFDYEHVLSQINQRFHGESSVVVTGASSFVGREVLEQLAVNGCSVLALSRTPQKYAKSGLDRIFWIAGHRFIIENISGFLDIAGIIHTAPVWVLPDLLRHWRFQTPCRCVALSSSSAESKKHSPAEKDRELSRRLCQGEDRSRELASELSLDLILFRPTMIYDNKRDQNIRNLRRFIERFHFFPLAGEGSGKRQPIHSKDVSLACTRALLAGQTLKSLYYLTGSEMLTYREMIERIFNGLAIRPRIVCVPVSALRILLSFFSFLPGLRFLTPEMADRMNQDLVFDNVWYQDLGIEPVSFLSP